MVCWDCYPSNDNQRGPGRLHTPQTTRYNSETPALRGTINTGRNPQCSRSGQCDTPTVQPGQEGIQVWEGAGTRHSHALSHELHRYCRKYHAIPVTTGALSDNNKKRFNRITPGQRSDFLIYQCGEALLLALPLPPQTDY